MTTAYAQAYEALQHRCLRERRNAEIAVLETAMNILLRTPNCVGKPSNITHNAIREARRFLRRRDAVAKVSSSDLALEARTVPAVGVASDSTEVEVADWISKSPLNARGRAVLRGLVAGDTPVTMANALDITASNFKVLVHRVRKRAEIHYLAVVA